MDWFDRIVVGVLLLTMLAEFAIIGASIVIIWEMLQQ